MHYNYPCRHVASACWPSHVPAEPVMGQLGLAHQPVPLRRLRAARPALCKAAANRSHSINVLGLLGASSSELNSDDKVRSSTRPKSPYLPGRSRVLSSAVFVASASNGGGVFGGSSGGGGGGGGGPSGGGGWGGSCFGPGSSQPPNVLADLSINEAAEMVEEVILLDVGGMKCGGCVGHVKKILESQPGVMQATVNLATETALVHVMVPKGSTSDHGILSPHAAAVGDKLSQVLKKEGYVAQAKCRAQ